MGGEAHEALAEGIGFAHDALADVFFGPQTVVLFLKPATDESREFDTIYEAASKWFFEYSDFRHAFILELAAGSEITSVVTAATHIQIDDDVYEISQADTLEPKGTDVTWKLFCTRYAKRTNYAGL